MNVAKHTSTNDNVFFAQAYIPTECWATVTLLNTPPEGHILGLYRSNLNLMSSSELHHVTKYLCIIVTVSLFVCYAYMLKRRNHLK